ncbi:hypothetical protein YC2023_083433 [Brassica napus]|nr:unnamed protein product [Brassica napus]VDD36732.1 unnamed protein product [Brassica oleracea]
MTRLSIQSEMGCDDVRCENSKVDPFLRWVVKLNTIKTYNSNKYISSWENKNKTKKCFFFSLQLDRDHSVFFSGVIMTTSKRLADRKIEKFDKNITKRGFVPETTTKKGKDYPVGPILLGFFVFVVIGSSLFQIIRTATSGGMA